MASWQPPIPSGALYSRPARDIGTAVALLAWCYDVVRRDGTATFQLRDVADVMEEPYHTIRKWWGRVRSGPWFAEVIDHGHNGYAVRFADEWIEWRILSARGSKQVNRFEVPNLALEELPSRTDEAPDLVLEEPTNEPANTAQSLLKVYSKTDEAPNLVLEGDAIYIDQEIRRSGDQRVSVVSEEKRASESLAHSRTSPPPKRKSKAREPTTAVLNRFLPECEIVEQAFGKKLNPAQADQIAGWEINDMEKWKRNVIAYAGRGYRMGIDGLRDWYLADKARQQERGNGTSHTNGLGAHSSGGGSALRNGHDPATGSSDPRHRAQFEAAIAAAMAKYGADDDVDS